MDGAEDVDGGVKAAMCRSRPLPRHLMATSAQEAAGVQPGAHGRHRRRRWRREGCHVQLGGHLLDT
jgi:hypothetical protein